MLKTTNCPITKSESRAADGSGHYELRRLWFGSFALGGLQFAIQCLTIEAQRAAPLEFGFG